MTDPRTIQQAIETFPKECLKRVNGVWVNALVNARHFKYYIFDWDDNIIFMPTHIHLERLQPDGTWVPHLCSTSAFSVIRNQPSFRPPNNDWGQAFVEFQDCAASGGGRFIQDLERAITLIKSGKREAPPSFNAFCKTLIEGRLFAIVTARGHSAEVLREGVETFINRILTPVQREIMLINLRGYRYCFDNVQDFASDDAILEYYLSLNHFHAVTSPDFNRHLASVAPEVSSQEDRKRFAIDNFVHYVLRVLNRVGVDAFTSPISVGFSDDDPSNLAAVEHYIAQTLTRQFPSIKFCVYDASDAASGTNKVVVSREIK